MSQPLTRFPDDQRPVLVEAPAAGSEPVDAPPADGSAAAKPRKRRPIGRRKGEEASAAVIAERAKADLKSITGLEVDHVSAVLREEDGWHVTVDLVELRRIPASTDVLAAYEAVLGPTGMLLSYQRTRRYMRDQMIDA